MIMTKLKFINSSRNEKERDEDTVKTTVTEMIIFELKKLLINAEMLLTLINETMTKTKWDWWYLSCWSSSLMSENAWTHWWKMNDWVSLKFRQKRTMTWVK